ncbi:TetR family transcriptional regulator [Rhodospirillum rubrum]|uniref:TetR/AcrR family transcriptional regulator n=1 Tax=Rhodospirillum rubrum TaxID=1085 RepID=UPI0019061C3A|nr:TetR/AcrR family transcriptional regulator [Rhodospirillum rubrum]MBK1664953.1 TetR family transcriptional regulator [Rhodospirillum rubrum]MBK1677219.1 TetR family transcriptional regulator [Rhodospirillum rubrum]
MARGNTRALILEAALDCFLAKGFAGTSIADIRARSGASTGSIYHFFDTKDGVALALCAEGLRSWAGAVSAVPAQGAAEGVIRAMVDAAINWALGNDRLHRFLLQSDSLAPVAAQRSDMVDALMEARLAQERILRDLTAKGLIRPMAWDMARAMILGPAESYLRERAHGRAAALPEEAKALLGEAAWQAVRADPQAKPKRERQWDLI